MKYGYFDDKNREYVITNPKTPIKWINYIGDLSFGGFVDHTGGALLCKGDPAINRITKYIPQLPSSDFKGTTCYIRIKQGANYKIFSPYLVPTLDEYQRYECHVGLGYTRIVSEFYGILIDVTIFVPLDGKQEIRDYYITNLRDKPVEIDIIPVVEYSHPNALMQFTNADWIPQTMQSKALTKKDERVILVQYPFMNKENKNNYFTTNLPVSSYESDRKIFLGDNEYGSWRKPLSLLHPELSNAEAVRGDNIAALMHHLGYIQPGDCRRLITQLGQTENTQSIQKQVDSFYIPQNVDQAKMELQNFWGYFLANFVIETPDQDMNQMLNVHNPRQIYITMNWSRYLSLYQLGFGSRGIGFRDTSQDIMGITAHEPEKACDLMRKLLSVQRQNGSAMHSFNPLTMIGSIGDAHEMEDRPKYYSDDHLWIILAACAYLKETGNFNILNEIIPFYEKDERDLAIETGTVLEHLQRGIKFTETDIGNHGLPRSGFADWNDTINLRTGAESLFTANLYGKAMLEMIALTEFLGDEKSEKMLWESYNKMKDRVNEVAWDGEWYLRYFDSDGQPLGSKDNNEGKIFTNAQSWSIISGFAPQERGIKALNSVNQYLNTPKGLKLSTPGYDGYDPTKGGVSTYPPGAKENGGIFLHTNPWVIIAEAMMGNGNRAFEYYNQINPARKNHIIDEYECEPYVYPQNILGDEHPQFGLARNHWLTGTASWIYQAATQFILGIQPSFKGLRIDPCIPSEWSGFKIIRKYRGAIYDIRGNNPSKISKGVKSIVVDGKEITGNLLPVFGDGKTHSIIVTLGNIPTITKNLL
jgi:cellobiose phosphorylase